MLTILAHRVDYKKYHYLVLIVCNCKERKLSLFSEVPWTLHVIISEESISIMIAGLEDKLDGPWHAYSFNCHTLISDLFVLVVVSSH